MILYRSCRKLRSGLIGFDGVEATFRQKRELRSTVLFEKNSFAFSFFILCCILKMHLSLSWALLSVLVHYQNAEERVAFLNLIPKK